MFYADWSPHYEWLELTIKEYEPQVEAVVKINVTENQDLAALYNAEDVPDQRNNLRDFVFMHII